MSLRPHAVTAVLAASLLCGAAAFAADAPPAPKMPASWKVTSDVPLSADQVKAMSKKLGADLVGVRNTAYAVDGKKVQLNVLITSDAANAEKLMAKLKSMKAEAALLRKELTVYEFVGQNDVLPLIAEGRKHLESQ